MFEIVIDSPVPDLKGLREDFSRQLVSMKSEFPDTQDFVDALGGIQIPNLLGLPKEIFSKYSNTVQEVMEIIDAIKYQADTLTMMNVFQPLVSVLGGSLESLLPKIPVLGISLIDIVGGRVQGLYDAVKLALQEGVKLPFVPLKIFEGFSNFEKEALIALKMILVGYKEMLLNTMQSMISSAMSILKISGTLPILPEIPSIDQLKSLALNSFPEYDTWYNLVRNLDPTSILSAIGFGMFVIPEINFLPNYSNYEQYLMESLNQIKDAISSIALRLLVNFVENTLGMLGFKFPTITIRI